MDTFEPQQPDEGYSEAPLSNASVLAAAKMAGNGLPHALLQHINSLSSASKIQLVETLLESLPTNVVAQIVQKLSPRLYIDFIRYLPPEICLNILGYLDPLSLLSVARSCRAWYGLALDRKLWEALYYLEGWKTIAPALRQWEELVNRDRPVASEGSRMSKRRAITSSSRRAANTDRDHVMLDATPEPQTTSPSPAALPQQSSAMSTEPASSIFGSSASTVVGSQQPSFSQDDSQESTSSGESLSANRKGKQRASSPPPETDSAATRHERLDTPSDSLAGLTLPMAITNSTLPRSALWAWDAVSERYRLNWKHLYTLRRRLESNWELGKFTNFQFPHPDHPEEAHGECIYTIQFNAEFLVSGSRDRSIRIWSMKTRRLVQRPLVAHKGSVLCLQFDSDPSEDLIVSGSSDSKVILWKFSTGELLQRLANAHREPVLNVKFDKNILVTCSKDKTIKIFNRYPLRAGDLGYDSSPGVKSAVNPVPVQLKNYTDGSNLLDQMPIKPAYSLIGILEGHNAAVNAVQIHGREIVSASGDRNVKIWDWPSQSCVRTLIGHSKGIACVQYDGRRIVSGSSDNEVKVFDRTTGLEVACLRAHKILVRTVQAGFGDLPYSQDEDEKAAARFDAKYREYYENGLYENAAVHRRRHARTQGAAEAVTAATAGQGAAPDAASQAAAQSSAAAASAAATAAEDDEDFLMRPENIRFTGAKLPPGGGGGPYGRIVSGSYDTTIIIWRQDRRGVWKAQHHLRQEEASAAAAAAAAAEAASIAPRPQAPIASLATAGAAPAQAMHVDAPETTAEQASRSGPPLSQHQTNLMTILESAVEQGPQALRLTLTAHPELLYADMSALLNEATRRNFSPMERTAMDGVVAEARQSLGIPLPVATAPTVAGPSGATNPATNLYASETGTPPTPHAVMSATAPAALGYNSHTATPGLLQAHQQMLLQRPPLPPLPHQHLQHQGGAAAAIAAGAGGDNGANNPARVFKLQFDASQIICCSQAPVIVGWDFCNGDAELEEASKFFGTIE